MNHLWSNYRNRMDIESVEGELQIRMNSDIHYSRFYDFLLTQDEVLTKKLQMKSFSERHALINELQCFSISVLNCIYE